MASERELMDENAKVLVECGYQLANQAERITTLTAENERLSARVERLEAALKPFAEDAACYDPDEGDSEFFAWDSKVKIGDLRIARRELEEGK